MRAWIRRNLFTTCTWNTCQQQQQEQGHVKTTPHAEHTGTQRRVTTTELEMDGGGTTQADKDTRLSEQTKEAGWLTVKLNTQSVPSLLFPFFLARCLPMGR